MSEEVVSFLLIEDEEADISIIKRTFKSLKIANNLIVARNGKEALELLRNEEEPRPYLILLDLNMPVMDGKSFLSEFKNDPKLSSIPVAVMTSSEAEEDVIQSYDLGANCYIRKPIDYDELKKVLSTIENFWLKIVTLPR